ncbi:hypothetical protein, partial [Brytella acorum]
FFIASLYRQYQSSLTYHPMSDMKANTAVNSAIFGRLLSSLLLRYKAVPVSDPKPTGCYF